MIFLKRIASTSTSNSAQTLSRKLGFQCKSAKTISFYASPVCPATKFRIRQYERMQVQQIICRSYSELNMKSPAAAVNEDVMLKTSSNEADDETTKKDEVNYYPIERMKNQVYTYIRSQPAYQPFLFQHEAYSQLMTEEGRLTPAGEEVVSPSVKAFIDLCNTSPTEVITDQKYNPVLSDLAGQAENLSDDELILVLYNLRRFQKRPSNWDPIYKKFWNPLDNLCLKRFLEQAWTYQYMFHIVDLMYTVGLVKHSRFHWAHLKKLYRRVDYLSKEEFVLMAFCFGAVKALPAAMSVYNVEYNLARLIEQFTPEEVVIVASSYLRTKSLIHDPKQLKKMLDIIGQASSTVPSSYVHTVARTVRLAPLFPLRNEVYSFLDAFTSEVPRIDVNASANLALLGVKAKVEHEQFLKEVVMKVEGTVRSIRIKDLEFICAALTTFSVDCKELYQEVIENFRTAINNRTLESFHVAYGRSFVNILHYLSQVNIYPLDLISVALSKEFLYLAYGRSMYTYTMEVAFLNICTELEAKGYDGRHLSHKYRDYLTKKNMLWMKKGETEIANSGSDYRKMARFMFRTCTGILGGPEFGHLCSIVPPFRTIGIVFCTDEVTRNPIPVPDEYRSMDSHVIKHIPKSDCSIKYHAFVLFPGGYIAGNTLKPIGIATMHCRQLKKMGYSVHPYFLGFTIRKEEEMKEAISSILGHLNLTT